NHKLESKDNVSQVANIQGEYRDNGESNTAFINLLQYHSTMQMNCTFHISSVL
ncbi:Hypothetical predicted protein, partial [Olea europaea subsp. europaea]